eukprot:2435903-Karenia_brevis.AAC.1
MAAKLRGMLNALDLGPLDKTQRSNGCTDGECWESGTEINDSLSKAFWYMKHVLLTQQPRSITVGPSVKESAL